MSLREILPFVFHVMNTAFICFSSVTFSQAAWEGYRQRTIQGWNSYDRWWRGWDRPPLDKDGPGPPEDKAKMVLEKSYCLWEVFLALPVRWLPNGGPRASHPNHGCCSPSRLAAVSVPLAVGLVWKLQIEPGEVRDAGIPSCLGSCLPLTVVGHCRQRRTQQLSVPD